MYSRRGRIGVGVIYILLYPIVHEVSTTCDSGYIGMGVACENAYQTQNVCLYSFWTRAFVPTCLANYMDKAKNRKATKISCGFRNPLSNQFSYLVLFKPGEQLSLPSKLFIYVLHYFKHVTS